MKQILFCIMILAASGWSVVGLWSSSLRFEQGYLSIDSTKIPAMDSTLYKSWQGKGFAYYSMLDTNCAVFSDLQLPKIKIYCHEPHDSLYYVLTDVLRYEFMNWQKWGFLKMTKDSAQKLIDKVIPERVDLVNTDVFFKKTCEETPSVCYFATGAAGGGMSQIPASDAEYLPQKKILAETVTSAATDTLSSTTADSSSKNPETEQPKDSVAEPPKDSATVLPKDSIDLTDADSVASAAVALIDSAGKTQLILRGSENLATHSLIGLRYNEFDLNGVLIRSGIWQGSFKPAGAARIVRFENGKNVIFR